MAGQSPLSPAAASRPPMALVVMNTLGYLLLIVVNVLSSIGVLGGSNADVSAKYDTPLTPAGYVDAACMADVIRKYAFSIWGLIFALEGAGVVYQVLAYWRAGRQGGGWLNATIGRIGYGWQAGWMCQNAWQICFVQQSKVGMWLAAVCLLSAYGCFMWTLLRMDGPSREHRPTGQPTSTPSTLSYALYKLPTSVNAAWLSAATSVGLIIVPVAHGVPRASLVVPGALLAVAITLMGLWRLIAKGDTAYGLTLVWALVAITVKDTNARGIKGAGAACATVLAALAILLQARRWQAAARNQEARQPLRSETDQGSSGEEEHKEGKQGQVVAAEPLLSPEGPAAGEKDAPQHR